MTKEESVMAVNVTKLSNGAKMGFVLGIMSLILNAAALVWGAATINAKVDEAARLLESLSENQAELVKEFTTERIENAGFRGQVNALHGLPPDAP